DLADGAVGWTAYGSAGLRVESASRGAGTASIALAPSSTKPSGGAWNFPLADSGEISFRMKIPAGVSDLRFSLNDHFNRIDDAKAAEHAVFLVSLEKAVPGDTGQDHAVG